MHSIRIYFLFWIVYAFNCNLATEIIRNDNLNVTVSINNNKITIYKELLIYETSFTELFATGSIQHDFRDNDKAKQTLIKHQKKLTADVYEKQNVTYIKYHSEYFEIVIKIPNHLFEIDLANCSESEQLKYYKNKYEEHVKILTLNNYKIDVINMNQLQDSNFSFKMYEPDEIIYDHKGFTPPTTNYNQISRQEFQLNLLKSFYDSIIRGYGITNNVFDNYELEIATFLSRNNINITQNKYYKKIDQHIYYIKDNQTPHMILNVFNDQIVVSNLNLLYLQLHWITCLKDITSYFIDLIDVFTKDQVITRLPLRPYFVDTYYQSDIFIINVNGHISTNKYNAQSKNRNNKMDTVYSRFVISLLYQLVIKNNVLWIEYIGAMKYYDTTFIKYDKNENVPIVFEKISATRYPTRDPKIGKIAKYQILVSASFDVQEKTTANKDRTTANSFSVTPNFPIQAVTLRKLTHK